jgi:hypothetical protein
MQLAEISNSVVGKGHRGLEPEFDVILFCPRFIMKSKLLLKVGLLDTVWRWLKGPASLRPRSTSPFVALTVALGNDQQHP